MVRSKLIPGCILLLCAAGCGSPEVLEEPASAEAEEPALPFEIQLLVDRLENGNCESQRSVLTEMGVSPDPRVTRFVVPCLRSADPFVRHNAAVLLGELRASQAARDLIEILEDDADFVRDAAYGALRKITGQNLEFKAYGTAEQRRLGKRAWLSWYRKNRVHMAEDGE